MFRITGLSENDIWLIANTHVTPSQNNTLKGRADINTEDVICHDLGLEPDEPPDRHLNITRWSDDKSKNKLIAKEKFNGGRSGDGSRAWRGRAKAEFEEANSSQGNLTSVFLCK